MHRRGRVLGWVGALCALALLSLPATTSSPAATRTTNDAAASARAAADVSDAAVADWEAEGTQPHRIYLEEPQHGVLAIAALGEHLDEVAAMNSMSAAKLRALLTDDPSFWIGRDGRAFYADPVSEFAEPEPDGIPTTTGNAAMATYPESQTFQLHSLPGSTKTIYLDFDGIGLTSPNWWTDNYVTLSPTHTGFSLDDNPAFNSEERAYIQTVWRIVSEKYATFDVDVTTEDPGADAYSRSSLSDTAYGAHVVISSATDIASRICSGTCAGISLIGTFNLPLDLYLDSKPAGYLQPAWVFTSDFSAYPSAQSAYIAANVAAHEVGHQLGLQHDGVVGGSAYYDGQGNWVPVMGRSNWNAVVQFDKGEYTNANNPQDDFAVMATYGLSRRDDRIANAPAQADHPLAPVLGPITTAQVDGVIETRADVDVVRIDHRCDGDLTVAAAGIGPGSTLDIQLKVLDSTASVLAADDPAWQPGHPTNTPVGMDAALTMAALPAGTYYAQVDGVGRGTPSGDGYSDYGSVGQYRLTTTDCRPTAPTDVVATQTSGSNGTVSWTAPDNAADSVKGYRVTGLPGGDVDVAATSTSVPVSGLEGGRDYPISVKSYNNYGSSTPAFAELVVPTWSPTSAPTLTPTVTGSEVAFTWTPPANPGNAVLTGWDIEILDAEDQHVDEATFESPDANAWSLSLSGGTYRAVLTLHATADQQTDVPPAEVTFSVVGAPTDLAVTTFSRGSATLSWTSPTDAVPGQVTGYRVDGLPGGPVTTGDTSVPLHLAGNQTGDVTIVSLTASGESLPSEPLSIRVPTWQPLATPTAGSTVKGQQVTVSWTGATNPGNATLTGWQLSLTPRTPALGVVTLPPGTTSASYTLPSGDYSLSLSPLYSAEETGAAPGRTMSFSVRSAASAPIIGKAASGRRGKPVTVRARWRPPVDAGNSPIAGYVVVAKRVGPAAKGKKAKARKRTITTPLLGPGTRTYVLRLPKGRYKLRVVAYNAVGPSPSSAWSKKVTAR